MKKANKWLSLLLAFVMVLALIPSTLTPVYAAYEDGDECWNCGHYHWDEYMHECGACSPDCTNDWCALETHCHRCGGCLNGDYPCDECGLCKECMAEIGHCSQCDMCWMDNGADDVLCGNCRRCEFCSPICPECHMCEDCAGDESDGMHCPECGNCYQVTEQCKFLENNHCKECCEPCEQCGECIAGDALETCPDCGLCVECCAFNSMMAGCESGEICVDSADWIDCICEGCGEFFENQNGLCDTCLDAGVVRCPNCCELASECSEKMCEYDDEYEDHFCIDCGSCFHDVTLCESCEAAGELRCEDCCENLTNSLGCDGSCGDVWCSNDTYFEQHLEEEHEDHPDFDDHDAFPSNRWSHDKNSHWRDCRLCDEDENEALWASHRASLAAHSYNSNGVCTVCGYSVGNKLYISRQPRTIRCTTSIAIDYDEDTTNGLLWFDHHPVTFAVAVKGGTGSYTYQWYRIYKDEAPTKLEDGMLSGQFSGTHTATLAVLVSPEACGENGDYLYYCVISDGKTTVTTEKVTIKASHAYSNKEAINTESTDPKKATYKAVSLTYLSSKGETVTVTAPASEGHRHQCLSESGNLSRHYKSKRPVMHTFGDPVLLGKSAKAGATDFDKVYEKTCTACRYKTYYESHMHVYHTEESDERYNRGTFQVDEEKTTNMAHALVCLVDGCGHIKMESHEWDWRHGDHGSDEDGGGMFYRICRICEYPDYDYRPVDKDGNKINWSTKNVLVTAVNAQVSRTLAKENDKLTLTINNNSYTQGKRCTGWTVEYIDPNGQLYDITAYYKHNIVWKEGGEWNTTIKLAGCKTGGYLIFTPTMVDCASHEYVIEGYVAPVCMYDGFAGYRICKHCHTADPADIRSDEERIIPATGTAHTGNQLKLYEKEVLSPTGKKTITWTTNRKDSNGKRYNAVAGNCHTKGCEGDFLCSACQRVIPGKREFIHSDELEWRNEVLATCGRNGYQGDGYCQDCGKFIRKGYVIEVEKGHIGPIFYDYDHNETDATCTTAGKTSAQYCYTCMEKVAEGLFIPPLGHNWVVDTAHCTAATTAYKCNRAGCLATKFADIVANPHTITVTVDGGTANAYVGGSLVEKAAPGETVTLKLGTVPAGKRFKEWECVSGGVAIRNAASPDGAAFTMGSQPVEIYAVLEDHTHSYDTTWKVDDTHHWHGCVCGAKTDRAKHTFEWKVDKEATEAETGLKHEECSVCGWKRSESTVIDKLPSGGGTNPGGNTTPGGSSDPSGGTGNPDAPQSPRTGEPVNLFSLIALLIVSGGVTAAVAVKRKKREATAE